MINLLVLGSFIFGSVMSLLTVTLATRFDSGRLRRLLTELAAIRDRSAFTGIEDFTGRCSQAHNLFFRYVEGKDFLVWWFDSSLLRTRAAIRTVRRLDRQYELYQLDETNNYQRSKDRLAESAVSALESLVGDLGEAVRRSSHPWDKWGE